MKFLLLFFILNLSFVEAQEFKFSVVDEDSLILSNFFVSKNSENFQLVTKEEYVLKVKIGDTITIRKSGFHDGKYIILSNESFIYHTFVLEKKYRDLEEVKITSERYKKVAGEINENILDYVYYPAEQKLLLIKSIKRKYYLEQKTNTKTNSFELTFKPQALYLDVFGNTHIISKDSSYQIWIEDSLIFISVIPKELFEKKVQNLVYKSKDFVFYENRTNFNQLYTLTKTGQDNKIIEVANVFDEIAYKTAQSEYNSIIRTYHRKATILDNVITNGIWDGDVMRLTCGDCDTIVYMTTWFLKIRSKPIECYAYGRMNNIEILNLYNSSLDKFDFNGRLIQQRKISIPITQLDTPIYDFFYDELYLINKYYNEKSIYLVNKTDDKIELITKIDGQEPTKIKIVGNEIYFLQRNDSGFNKLITMHFTK